MPSVDLFPKCYGERLGYYWPLGGNKKDMPADDREERQGAAQDERIFSDLQGEC